MLASFAIAMPGGPELIFILLVLVLFFGAKRLPELSRSIGRSLSEFKKGRKEGLLEEEESKAKQKREDAGD